MGCSSSVVSKDISKPELMAPQSEEPITERPGQKAENNEFKPPETPDENDLHARSVNEQLSRPPFPFKKGRTDSCMEDSRPQSRYGQALKIQNMPIVANSQPGKLPASFLRNRQENLLETVRKPQHKPSDLGSNSSIVKNPATVADKKHLERDLNDEKKSASRVDKARHFKNHHGALLSRQSSREHSVGGHSNKKNRARVALNGEEKSESDHEKSPFKFNNPKQASIFQRQGQANILDNIGGSSNYSYIRYNTMDQHKKPREEEPSVTVDNSQLVNTTIAKPYMSGSIKPAGSLFKQQAEAKQVNPRNRIMAEMKARNFTTDYAAMSSKKHALEYDDDDSDSEINPSNMNNRTITRRERKLCTNFTVRPAANEFTMKYRDFSWIASGSYATVERCYRKSDNAEFVMKYMAVRDIVDKIVRLVCGLGRKEAENMAILLCDNEIEVSRVLAPNSNISTIDDYYFDKVEGSYRLFSRFAQHGTLMSESHIRYVAMMSDHNSPEIPYIYKKSLFRNIVEGLQHMHHKGIVHRDLKCENILIFDDGSARLTDFSVSLKSEQTDSDLLKLGTTKICQSPEMWENSSYVDFPHDIWSLGVVLWELVFKKPPFNTTAGEATFKQEVLSFTPVFPEGDVEDSLKELLIFMLQQDPSKRWTIDQVAKSPWIV